MAAMPSSNACWKRISQQCVSW